VNERFSTGSSDNYHVAAYEGTLDLRFTGALRGVAYVNLATKGFQERGSIAALSSARDNEGVTYSTVGMNAASMFFTAGGTTTRLRSSLGWRHAFDS
jgi:uncharacterized protein with beta-barrel porin domain